MNAALSSGQTGPRLEVSQQMDAESWDEKVEELSQIVSGKRVGERRLSHRMGTGAIRSMFNPSIVNLSLRCVHRADTLS